MTINPFLPQLVAENAAVYFPFSRRMAQAIITKPTAEAVAFENREIRSGKVETLPAAFIKAAIPADDNSSGYGVFNLKYNIGPKK